MLQCLDQLRKMHLPKLSESCMDDFVELSWAQSCSKKKNRRQILLSIDLPFSFLLYFCRYLPVLGGGKPHTCVASY